MEIQIYDMGICSPARATQAKQKFHDEYGLWIFRWKRAQHAEIHTEPHPRVFEFYNISHLIAGNGWYWRQNERTVEFHAGDAVLNAPGLVHDYNGTDTEFVEDFVCFGGPLADRWAECGIFTPGVVTLGSVRKLLPIIDLVEIPSKLSQFKANTALQNLIMELYVQKQEARPGHHSLVIENVLHALRASPNRWWTVSEMASSAKLGVNQFIHIFKAETGMTPKQYLDSYKINLAADEIRRSDVSVTETAARFGYMNPFHFSKRFKQVIGMSPRDYKSQFRIPPESEK